MPMPRVLHVDDDPTVRRAVRRLFESSGWRVASAQNAAEVDDALARGSFDVAVIDLVIGEDDGLELIDRLARRDPELVLVLFSGTLTPAIADRALALGAAYLVAVALPCPVPGLDRTRAPATAPTRADTATHDRSMHDPAHHHHHHGAPQEVEPEATPDVAPSHTVQIPCPCGCGKKSGALAFGKLSPAIATLAWTDAEIPPMPEGVAPTPLPYPAPVRTLDPVPI